MAKTKDKYELSDNELGKVIGGLNNRNTDYDPKRTHEVQAGEFVCDAYRHASKDNN